MQYPVVWPGDMSNADVCVNWVAMNSDAELLEDYDPLTVTVVEVCAERGYFSSVDWDDDDTGEIDDLRHLYNPEE